jgi:hypothetical protein
MVDPETSTVVRVGTADLAASGATLAVASSGGSASAEAGQNPLQTPLTIMTSALRRMLLLRSKCFPDCLLSSAPGRAAAALNARAFSAMDARGDGMRLTL